MGLKKTCLILLEDFSCSSPRSGRSRIKVNVLRPGRTFLPNWWSLDWSRAEIEWYSTIAPQGILGPLSGSPNRLSHYPSDKRSWMFRRWQQHSTESAQHFSNSTAKSLPQFCAPLSQQSHLFPIGEGKFDDSMIDLHKICQILASWQYKWLLACVTAPRILTSFSPSPVQSLFCTDTTGSIRWPSPVRRLSIDDCVEIHILENSVICCHQITKMFHFWHDCTSAFSARSPCNFGPQTDVAISVLRLVSNNAVLARHHFCSRLWR